MRVHLLADQLISQIAAGEVVERPASVAKELIENALDAGARRIELTLNGGGRDLVVVRDDGEGMSGEDLAMAFKRHATSKIREFADLEKVASLGFRGEALASIAAVARVYAHSAPQPGFGFLLRIEGGRVEAVEPAGVARGTEISVRDLFFNVPARRAFLKRPATELRRCLEVVQGYALCCPTVAFLVEQEGKILIDAAVSSDDRAGRLERVAQLFGSSFASSLLPIEGLECSGFVGDTSTVGSRRTFIFVNGRLIRDRAILSIFYRAVRDQWKSERFPALFLHLRLPPEGVDVNVHPQKAEVRFRDSSVLGRIASALRAALAPAPGRSTPLLRDWVSGQRAPSVPSARWQGAGSVAEVLEGEGELGAAKSGQRIAEVLYPARQPQRVPLSGRQMPAPSLTVLGQYKGSLLLVEAPEALLVIDQHAAHERVLYERMLRQLMAREVTGQRLLVPVTLEVDVNEVSVAEESGAALQELGYEISLLGASTIAVRCLPSALDSDAALRLLSRFLARAAGSERVDLEVAAVAATLREEVAASMACRSAIRIHRPLSDAESRDLVVGLFSCDEPYSCPHGRPTVLRMEDADLERRFGRR